MREPGTWDKREVVTPTSFILNLKQIAETWEFDRRGCWLAIHVSMFKSIKSLNIAFLLLFHVFVSCNSDLNPICDPHFDNEGYAIVDSAQSPSINLALPQKIKFYVEVSGSMNGFFRPNKPTHFKSDVWFVMSYYSVIAPEVTILTNEGKEGKSLGLNSFRTNMNSGLFVSSASTKVPVMLQSIINNLDVEAGEVAVLISDMKYSPVGNAAPEVLLTQYSTDVAKILGDFGYAASLICATSNYVDKTGQTVCERSPYYYLILGKQENVAKLRNDFSTLLNDNGHFVDNIETGFDYGKMNYDFGIPYMCEQLESEPSFYNYEEATEEDTCIVQLKLQLDNYRWVTANSEVLASCIDVKTLHGSKVSIGNIDVQTQNIIDSKLERHALATIELKVFDMPLDADVLEWSLNLPDQNITLFNEFIKGATDENDVSRSYSLDGFLRGMFYGGIVNKKLNPNYILISKNS